MNGKDTFGAICVGICLGWLSVAIILNVSNRTPDEMYEKGRQEILTGKFICVLDKMEEDKPKFICKTKEEFNKDIEFLLKSGVLKKKEGNTL